MTMTPERARELIGHTPGPWYLDYPTLVAAYDQEDVEKPWSVARVIGLCGSPVQTTENARLIAAAPDLLTAYLALVEENERLREERDYWIEAATKQAVAIAAYMKEPKP